MPTTGTSSAMACSATACGIFNGAVRRLSQCECRAGQADSIRRRRPVRSARSPRHAGRRAARRSQGNRRQAGEDPESGVRRRRTQSDHADAAAGRNPQESARAEGLAALHDNVRRSWLRSTSRSPVPEAARVATNASPAFPRAVVGRTGSRLLTLRHLSKSYVPGKPVLQDIDLASRRARHHGDHRAVGHRQEHADPLHQSPRRADGGRDPVRRRRPREALAARHCARRAGTSAWCSRSTTWSSA